VILCQVLYIGLSPALCVCLCPLVLFSCPPMSLSFLGVFAANIHCQGLPFSSFRTAGPVLLSCFKLTQGSAAGVHENAKRATLSITFGGLVSSGFLYESGHADSGGIPRGSMSSYEHLQSDGGNSSSRSRMLLLTGESYNR
jgi:hypothetical protein